MKKIVTMEDKEIELEMEKIDREIEHLISKKQQEFSFEVKEELEHYPEIDQLNIIIDKSIEDYKVARKLGQFEEAKIYKATIKEMKFSKAHLNRVMNMDFNRPSARMKEMAKKSNINLNDPRVIEEFKMIQQ